MTDLLDGTDLLSEREVAPKAPEPSGEPILGRVSCDYCERSWPAVPMARAWKNGHTKQAHPEHWTGKPTSADKPKGRPKARKETAPRAPTAQRATQVTAPRRKSSADFFTKNLTRVAKFLENVSSAGGRSLAFSAPSAGPAIDSLIAGTRIDKPVQRLATVSDKWEKVADAVGLPIMVTLCDMNPALFPLFEDDIRDAIEGVLIDALPALKRKREKQRQLAVALSDLGELDPELAATPDPIGAILAGFFAPRPGQVEPEPGDA